LDGAALPLYPSAVTATHILVLVGIGLLLAFAVVMDMRDARAENEAARGEAARLERGARCARCGTVGVATSAALACPQCDHVWVLLNEPH
jgi:Zn finger protein HypA/HybF involved in hydrogenase expression